MKKIIFCSIFCFFALGLKSQTEIKINPIILLFEGVQVGVEQIIKDDWGVDLDVIFVEQIFYSTLAGKYYFNPKIRADGFNFGIFTGVGAVDSDTTIGIGFMGGYKWLSRKNVVFEISGGIGRATIDYIPYFKLHFGYRLNSKHKDIIPTE